MDRSLAREIAMKMLYAASPAEALSMAQAIKGEDASVTVIPNGVSVII